MSTRTYHHGNLRSALLESAEEVLGESGAGALSLREVARRVGVSHAAPRRHFADRQALLDALAEEGFERLGRELEEALNGASHRPRGDPSASSPGATDDKTAGEPARLSERHAGDRRVTAAGFDARLAAFARAYVGFAAGHAALLELMFAGKHREGAADSLRAAADRAFAAPFAAIAEAQAAGDIVAGDPESIGTVVFAALQGLATMVSIGMLPAQGLDAVVDDAVARLVLGLRPR